MELMRLNSSGLAKSLSIGSSVIALCAVLAVAWVSIGLLGQLAEQQALARAELAGAAAREHLVRVNDNLLNSAQILAERPTLSRLINQRNRRALKPFLDKYNQSNRLYASAALNSSGIVTAAAGGDVLWTDVFTAYEEQGERFVLASRETGLLLIGASAPVSQPAGYRVITLRAVDAGLLAELQEKVGAKVDIINFATYTAPADSAFTELHDQAISASLCSCSALVCGHRRTDRPDRCAA
jgi:hypothetical protein